MNTILNGKPVDVAADKLEELLVELGYADAVGATAVNEDFVPKDRRAAVSVKPGDRLEVVAPLRGG